MPRVTRALLAGCSFDGFGAVLREKTQAPVARLRAQPVARSGCTSSRWLILVTPLRRRHCLSILFALVAGLLQPIIALENLRCDGSAQRKG